MSTIVGHNIDHWQKYEEPRITKKTVQYSEIMKSSVKKQWPF